MGEGGFLIICLKGCAFGCGQIFYCMIAYNEVAFSFKWIAYGDIGVGMGHEKSGNWGFKNGMIPVKSKQLGSSIEQRID